VFFVLSLLVEEGREQGKIDQPKSSLDNDHRSRPTAPPQRTSSDLILILGKEGECLQFLESGELLVVIRFVFSTQVHILSLGNIILRERIEQERADRNGQSKRNKEGW
jgi:hypothetical protein